MKLNQIIANIKPIDPEKLASAHEHSCALAIPPLALGRLHELGERLAAIQGTLAPRVERRLFLVLAGDHGVAVEGVSAFPQEVTGEMVKNFLAGGASINALAREAGAEVWVADMGIIPDLDPGTSGGQLFINRKVARGTANLAQGPAMSRAQAEQAIMTGFELASEAIGQGVEMLGAGDMGIANTTPSTAIAAALTGRPLEELVGRGTGLDDPGLANKRRVIARGLEINQPDPGDGLDVLAKVGGFEIGGIAGCVLAAAHHRKPLVIDGLISTAGALIAHALCPAVAGYVFAGHRSQEPAHQAMLARLGLEPILDLGMRLGEGTGAALAMQVLGGAARVMRQVLTFEQAGVSQG
ncbi:MAG: nicotinate-nucleotide--dimethylbenzimidazole phosphoribosyltransferase [Desulfarculaceae bacterium]|nr:nicotinate-nucleotide--dimethylbenzimidazole phosphoribosyltransferase [Desulfarculaceae bacterium]MCF8072880.1 nicotinate-nucleotide--dimethylbenzimidazole phosphoribosyltransferase [Desulfarculaceae bacterium]MCF8101048.1 nicotinate-nucleotide--dimethylbenzimidazole phosphoribosyltransferase [Desulfarculaceae bacterium]MCF8115565.1 nicotinate-nucleotide--dimethylbenzimidazole phosphoribosyltransferase [Desulfarculaceae bacterium]